MKLPEELKNKLEEISNKYKEINILIFRKKRVRNVLRKQCSELRFVDTCTRF